MKFLFIVQGEGRGHMTQAISLFDILTKNGHEVCEVIVGKSKRRELPQFFLDSINAPVKQLPSPNFVTDRDSKSVHILRSIWVNLLKIRTFLRSVKQIDKIVRSHKPDAIINFYDFLGGLYFLLKKNRTMHIAVAHQFLVHHSTFTFPKGRLLDKASLKFGNNLAGFGARKRICLSFQPFENEKKRNLYVVPPLLRQGIKTQPVSSKEHFLVYMVNHGYSPEVERFHAQHPDIPIHCFWDKKDMPEVYEHSKNLTFHQLNDTKFIELMSSCKGYLTTAGFESVCEAMHMGKPVLMVPVRGHYEQACNAIDAMKAGAGIASETFDLEVLLSYLPSHQNVKDWFHEWSEKTEQLFIQTLTKNVN